MLRLSSWQASTKAIDVLMVICEVGIELEWWWQVVVASGDTRAECLLKAR
jgi:hypothetical protein